jgi:MFS family permease
LGQYRQIFAAKGFRNFWLGFSFSVMGDAMSRVALTWYVLEKTQAPEALGLLSLAYTGPVILSGLFVGAILDRFDRRNVMIIDNPIRGTIMALIPLLHLLNLLELWHIYLASAVYGSLVMVSLAGSPALVPDLVSEEDLPTANALETLSYTVSAVLGPVLAGFLIPLLSAPNLVLLDALSYWFFALMLLQIPRGKAKSQEERGTYRFQDAFALLIKNPVLLSTTLMFMAANLALGVLMVWLPIFCTSILNGDSSLYGMLLGVMAIGEVLSSTGAGMLQTKWGLGKLIILMQLLSALSLLLLLPRFSIETAMLSMLLLGFFSAPLTIWAQTLRMKIIPAALRGRVFALLRTLMQSTNPIGGMIGGFFLPFLGMLGMLLVSAFSLGFPAVLGAFVKDLREAN